MDYEKTNKRFFSIKVHNYVHLFTIYHKDCLWKDDYLGETTERKEVTRLCEHNNPTHDSEPMHHLSNHLNNSFNWFISANASNDKWKKKTWKQNILLEEDISWTTKLNIINVCYLETVSFCLNNVISCSFSMICHSFCMDICLKFE